MKKYRNAAERLAAGVCRKLGCGGALATKRYCRPCADADNARSKAAKEAAKAEGLCEHCKKRPLATTRLCRPCADAGVACSKAAQEAALAKGLCVTCRKRPLLSARYCRECHDKNLRSGERSYLRKKMKRNDEEWAGTFGPLLEPKDEAA
mgnify:CR=1 FL=1